MENENLIFTFHCTSFLCLLNRLWHGFHEIVCTFFQTLVANMSIVELYRDIIWNFHSMHLSYTNSQSVMKVQPFVKKRRSGWYEFWDAKHGVELSALFTFLWNLQADNWISKGNNKFYWKRIFFWRTLPLTIESHYLCRCFFFY